MNEIIYYVKELVRRKPIQGTSGNGSVRDGGGMWINPSALPEEACHKAEIIEWMAKVAASDPFTRNQLKKTEERFKSYQFGKVENRRDNN